MIWPTDQKSSADRGRYIPTASALDEELRDIVYSDGLVPYLVHCIGLPLLPKIAKPAFWRD